MALRLHLLGGARIERDGIAVTGRAAQRRRIAILALLVRASRRTLTRERILAFLWPEATSDAARRLLTEAVYIIRRELGAEVIEVVGDELSLSAAVACDVDDFLVAMDRGDPGRAVAAYAGPFLDGWYIRDALEFERWAEGERVELAAAYLKALRTLTGEREQVGDWPGAAQGWQAILRIDPYSSTAALHAGRALVAAGEPAAALQLVAAHEALLREDLGVELDADLARLHSEIREGKVRPRRPTPPDDAPPAAREAEGDARPAALPPRDATGFEPASATSAPPGATTRRPRWPKVLASGLVTALLGWGMLTLPDRLRPRLLGDAARASAVRLDPARIAVLYFDHQPSDTGILADVADGLAEGLIRELGDVSALRVLSRDAVRPFAGGGIPADSLGRALGAGTVISGTVREAGGRVRVTARLVDAATGDQVATVQVEQPATSLFALEDSLALHTAAALRRRLGDAVALRAERRAAEQGGRNEEALRLVLRADRLRRDAEAARTSVQGSVVALDSARAGLQLADSLLAAAESLDPSWARVALSRGWVAATAGRLEHGTARVVALSPGLGHAERALTLVEQVAPGDRRLRAAALHLRGVLRIRTATAVQTFRPEGGLLRQGEADLAEAVRLDSTLAGAWAALSASRWLRGEFEGSELAAARAIAADAFLEDAGDVIGWAWRSAFFRGDRVAAARWCSRGRQLLPRDWHFIECELTIQRLDAAGLTGVRPDPARAWALVRELEQADTARARLAGRPYSPVYRRLSAAAVSAAAGQADTARAVLAAELARVRGDAELATDVLYDAAFVHVVLGDTTRARALLAEYLRARPDLAVVIDRDPTVRAARPARPVRQGSGQ